jgi:hypothetical protein
LAKASAIASSRVTGPLAGTAAAAACAAPTEAFFATLRVLLAFFFAFFVVRPFAMALPPDASAPLTLAAMCGEMVAGEVS